VDEDFSREQPNAFEMRDGKLKHRDRNQGTGLMLRDERNSRIVGAPLTSTIIDMISSPDLDQESYIQAEMHRDFSTISISPAGSL